MLLCHSNVLSAASDYFQALFCSEFEVKENRDNFVEIKEIKSSIMHNEDVLEFMYLGQADISSSNVFDQRMGDPGDNFPRA